MSLAPYTPAAAQVGVKPNTPSTTSSAASGPWYNQNFGQWSGKVFDTANPNEIFGERYTYAQVTWIIHSIVAIVTGPAISSCTTATTTGDLSKVAACLKGAGVLGMSGGAIPGLAGLTNSLVNAKPASGIGYIKDTANRLHVIPETYAQTGAGYNTLQPIQILWSVVRDISYALMVVVIIIMAFLIMFRVKISPQVIISVQSALPKIAIALVLITFSYAIAGFLVDLAYVFVGAFAAMINIAGTTGPKAISSIGTPALFTQLTSGNGLVSVTIGLLDFTIRFAIGGLALTAIGIVGTVTVVGLPIGILGALILLVGVVFILWILFRLFWLMVKTASITVLLIIVGPLMILMGTLSNAGGFGGWIKSIAGNLAVYPTVIIMVFLSHYFFWGWFLGTAAGAFGVCGPASFNTFCIQPVGFGIVNLPGMPFGTPILGFLLAFMILFLIPKAADIVQSIITGKAFNYGAAIGEAFGPSRGLVTGSLGFASGQQQQRYQEAQRQVQANPKLSIPTALEREKDFWNFIRGTSRGQIK